MFKRWIWMVTLVGAVSAEPVATMTVVNAVGSRMPLQASVDGRDIRDGGIFTGSVSGAIRLSVGNHALRLSVEGMSESRVSVPVVAGDALVMVVYRERLKSGRGDRLRVLRVATVDAGESRVAMLVSVAQAPSLDVHLEWADGRRFAQPLSRRVPARVEIPQLRGYVPIWVDGKRLSSMAIGSAGTHVVVIHDGDDAGLQAMVFKVRRVPEGSVSDGR